MRRQLDSSRGQVVIRSALAASVGCTLLFAKAAPAASDMSGANLEEIIVTAQKKSERLQDVPVPVAVVSAEALAVSNQTRLQDYYSKVPGLSLVLISDASAPAVSIRGVTTGGATNAVVGFVVDDIPYGATISGGVPSLAPDVNPSDLARVEVLRGPQGTLYGASSMGGLIKYVTVDPSTQALTGRIQAGATSVKYGDDTGYNLRGSINVPISDTFALRASGFSSRDPGYVDNLQANKKDVNQTDGEGGRLSALWQPSDALTVKVGALVQSSERYGTSDVDTSLGSGFQQRSTSGTGVYNRDVQAYTATINATVGAAELISATGYNIDKTVTDVDFPVLGFLAALFGVDGVSDPIESRIEKFSQEFRVQFPVGERLDWLVGAFFTDEDTERQGLYLARNSATGAIAGNLLTVDLPATYKEYAGFTNLTFNLTDRFNIQVGGRFSENEQTIAQTRSGPIAADFYGTNPSVVPKEKSSESVATYLLTPQFKLSSDVMMYARFASGYRPGGPNVGCGIATILCTYESDTTMNYELGMKGNFLDQRVVVDASVYYIDWSDIPLTRRITVPVFFNYLDNASEAKSQGVELSVDVRPFTGTSVSTWVAWNQAELTQDVTGATTIFAVEGDQLPYSPELSGNFSVAQEFPLGNSLVGTVGASVSYVSERKGLFTTTAVREEFPSYTQTDVHASLSYESWVVDLFVNNVADKRGILRSGVDSISPTFVTYIQPRTVGLSFSKSFE